MSATYHFNPYRDSRQEQKVWTIVVRDGSLLTRQHVATEAEARAAVGLKGGSTNPGYRPKDVPAAFEPVLATRSNGR